MMTIDEMRERKEELGYTYSMISEKSGVPLSTVKRVFGGNEVKPRYSTMEALEMVLKKPLYRYEAEAADWSASAMHVREEAPDFASFSGIAKIKADKVDHWTGKSPSEKWPRQGEYTVDDYLAVPDDERVELIDGVIYDIAAPEIDHQRLLTHISAQFYRCIDEHDDDCEMFFAPFDVRLDGDNRTVVQPDLIVICGYEEDEDRKKNKYYDEDKGKRLNGPPDLALEVLSPSTRRKDCTIKLRKYMNAGVKEYWIVDPKREKVLVYLFEKDELPTQYSFDDIIPIGISGGQCSIDFGRIKNKLKLLTKQSEMTP